MIDILSLISLFWLLLLGIAVHIVLFQQLWMWIEERFFEKVFSFNVAFYVAITGFMLTGITSVPFIILLAHRAITLIH